MTMTMCMVYYEKSYTCSQYSFLRTRIDVDLEIAFRVVDIHIHLEMLFTAIGIHMSFKLLYSLRIDTA
jgi:hypothetical protein